METILFFGAVFAFFFYISLDAADKRAVRWVGGVLAVVAFIIYTMAGMANSHHDPDHVPSCPVTSPC